MTSDEADIQQSLQILLSTRRGERVMLPDYGCNLDEMLAADDGVRATLALSYAPLFRDHLVQAGMYLLAAERVFGLEPAGMLFCGLRNPVTWDGWHSGIAGLERVGESRTRDALRELTHDAARAAVVRCPSNRC